MPCLDENREDLDQGGFSPIPSESIGDDRGKTQKKFPFRNGKEGTVRSGCFNTGLLFSDPKVVPESWCTNSVCLHDQGRGWSPQPNQGRGRRLLVLGVNKDYL